MTTRRALQKVTRRDLGANAKLAFALASRLLRYPDVQLLDDTVALETAVKGLNGPARRSLLELLASLASRPLLESQAEYVATFDLKRKCCLYLSYYLNGDTRRRGEALWRFQQVYRDAGWDVVGELPDYLPALLEFAATNPGREAVLLLEEHRSGIRVLVEALAEMSSPYAGAVRAVDEVLPPWDSLSAARAARLIAEGPPTELVGIGDPDGFGYPVGDELCGLETVPVGTATQRVHLARRGPR